MVSIIEQLIVDETFQDRQQPDECELMIETGATRLPGG